MFFLLYLKLLNIGQPLCECQYCQG